VVPKVGGHVGVDPGGAHLVEERVARAPDDRDGGDRPARRAGDPDPVLCRREGRGHLTGELLEGQGNREAPDAARPGRRVERDERRELDQADRQRERLSNPTDSGIGIRVRP